MARIARIVIPGHPHHVTQRGVRSMRIFDGDEDCEQYLSFMAEETKRYGVKILAWCLMSNHVHLIAVPREEASLAQAVGEAHKRYTRMKNFRDGARGFLFQGRFGSCVLDKRHLLAAARYIEKNPVRAGLAKSAAGWPWSSARFHLGRRKTDPLVRDRTLLGLVGGWGEFLRGEDAEAENAVRRRTCSGRPAGGARFTRRVERLTGRELSVERRGRPRKRRKV